MTSLTEIVRPLSEEEKKQRVEMLNLESNNLLDLTAVMNIINTEDIFEAEKTLDLMQRLHSLKQVTAQRKRNWSTASLPK